MLSMHEMEDMAHMLADEFDLRDKWGRQLSQKRYQGYKFFGNLRCPCCNKRKVGIYASQKTDNYLVKCWIDTCTLSKAVTLSYAINNYGSSTVRDAWKKKTGWIDYKTAYNFKPIKNRIPRGKSSKTDEDTFRGQMESRSIRQEVKTLMEIQ